MNTYSTGYHFDSLLFSTYFYEISAIKLLKNLIFPFFRFDNPAFIASQNCFTAFARIYFGVLNSNYLIRGFLTDDTDFIFSNFLILFYKFLLLSHYFFLIFLKVLWFVYYSITKTFSFFDSFVTRRSRKLKKLFESKKVIWKSFL